MSSNPASASAFSTAGAGRGVILSIMVQGKETLASSSTQVAKSLGAKPFSTHLFTMATTLLRIFSPFREQLSVLTTAMGYFPAL